MRLSAGVVHLPWGRIMKHDNLTVTCNCGGVFRTSPFPLEENSEILEWGTLDGKHNLGCPFDVGAVMQYSIKAKS
jgi:hypothetical protein